MLRFDWFIRSHFVLACLAFQLPCIMAPTVSTLNERGVSKYFKEGSDGRMKCICGIARKLPVKSGYSNLISHLNTAHPNWQKEMEADNCPFTTNVSRKAANVFSWIEWKICENREYEFCEK